MVRRNRGPRPRRGAWAALLALLVAACDGGDGGGASVGTGGNASVGPGSGEGPSGETTGTGPGTGGAGPGGAGPGSSAASATGGGGPASAACEPWPPPSGEVVDVGVVDGATLKAAVEGASAGTTVRLADGTYDLSGTTLHLTQPGVTLRSASGRREAVILDGAYATGEIVLVQASDVVIADVTLTRATYHPIHISGADDGDVVGVRIYNVVVRDPGQQGIKINTGAGGTTFTDDGLVACSHVELTDAGRPHVSGCYTGGIDAHQSRGWLVRDNTIEGFWCDDGLSEHGIHFWTGSRDTVVERNVIRDCARGIGLGLGADDASRVYDDGPCGGIGSAGHFGGVVRNNLVHSARTGFDSGIAVAQACDVTVVHNTVVSTVEPFASIEWRFAKTSGVVANNLASHALRERDGATATLAGNLADAGAAGVVDAAGGDLHLAADAAAIDAGDPAHAVPDDVDGETRTGAPDVGADERTP